MKKLDLSILNNFEELNKCFTSKLHKDSCFMFNLIGTSYDSNYKLSCYPDSVINQWVVTSDSEDDILVSNKHTCLKKCDEKTFNEYYGQEYNPVSIEVLTIPNECLRKYDNDNNLLYDISLAVHSIDDSGFVIQTYDLTLEKANHLMLTLIELIDSIKLISIDELEIYGKENGYKIIRY